MSAKPTSLADRFWPKVDKGPHPKGCWLWTGALRGDGYGVIGLGGRKDGIGRAHVISYKWTYGPVPHGLHVLHSCDNPPCVNPEHLSAGTRSDNTRQAVERGRFYRVGRHGNNAKGQDVVTAKLTNEDVKNILMATEHGLTHTSIAKNYGVCRSTISKISRGERYKEAQNGN